MRAFLMKATGSRSDPSKPGPLRPLAPPRRLPVAKPPRTLILALATGLLLATLAAGATALPNPAVQNPAVPNPAWPNPGWSQARLPMLVLTAADNGRHLDISQGCEVQLTLNENASTGYRWSLAPLDPTLLELVSAQALANPGDGASSQVPGVAPAVGSPGQVVYRFKALRPGRTVISLGLLRSWEGDRSSIDRFRLNLQIQAKSAPGSGVHPGLPIHP